MSPVFQNYDDEGEVNKSAHPAVQQYPWILQRDSQSTLIQPHERGTFFTPGGLSPVKKEGT